jgi:hypothetical protein
MRNPHIAPPPISHYAVFYERGSGVSMVGTTATSLEIGAVPVGKLGMAMLRCAQDR